MTSPDQTLTQLAERTALAISGVLEMYAPGAVMIGATSVLNPKPEDPLADFPTPSVATNVSYIDGVTGGNVLAITVAGAKRLAAAMMGADPAAAETEGELDEMELSAVSEAMNQMMAAAAGATAEVLGTEVEIGPPETRVLAAGESARDLCPSTPHATATAFTVLGETARIIQLVPNSFTVRMAAALDDLGIEATVRDDQPGRTLGAPSLTGITMRLTAELGRTRMPAGRAVTLADGAIVELDADVEAPIDLYVNGVRFGRGQLLVTEDGDWAVRVDEIFTPASDSDHNNQGGTAQWPVFSS